MCENSYFVSTAACSLMIMARSDVHASLRCLRPLSCSRASLSRSCLCSLARASPRRHRTAWRLSRAASKLGCASSAAPYCASALNRKQKSVMRASKRLSNKSHLKNLLFELHERSVHISLGEVHGHRGPGRRLQLGSEREGMLQDDQSVL